MNIFRNVNEIFQQKLLLLHGMSMKIFTGNQLRELDQYTIEHEPISSINLMERAAKAITHAIEDEWNSLTPVVVFAGPGNNGGDALATARLLAEDNYKVTVFLFNIHNHLSEDCNTNKKRLLDGKKVDAFTEISVNFEAPELKEGTLVIDGLFGSGLNKPLASGFAALVRYINQSPAQVVSIDIPSGLMCEDNTYNIRNNIIRADVTLTLQQKKLSMLLADNQEYLGQLKVLDIRLSQEYMAKTDSEFSMLQENDIRPLLKRRDDYSHKGEMGHALLIAGSYGMAGAATLAARACLRSGVGKLTIHAPKKNYDIMQISVPEAILHLDNEETRFSEPVNADDFTAMGAGPGLGMQEETAIALIAQIRRTSCPMVIDADAINLLANHRAWIQQLPKGMIFTPHPKELDKLAGHISTDCHDRLSKARELAEKMQAYIILKGHYSALCLPNRHVEFNSTGNSGMATAGSGDVLTGIITALLARGYKNDDACRIGMYLHGLAGDLAAKEIGKESLVASDIINYLPKAFLRLQD